MASIFTRIINGEIPCHKIDENDKFIAFLDVFPLVKGHTLVVPKKETDYIFDISQEELSEILIFAQGVAKKLQRAIPCKRIGISVIGLEVPHAHVHLVPMNSADDVNFTRPKLTVSAEEMASIADAIRNA